ncbi:MAG TPA: AsmA family protein [Candidatus Acidoferrum sp.]|nr:AsmA family protein [Candidatus Acidoferrum sp.]
MIRLRKYGGIAVLLLALLLVVQVGVSLFVRTRHMQGYLIGHLERAFGRPVQAGRFSVQVLPIPELDVDAVTIGEDSAFGNEYFLRAEHMTARLRWLGLMRGHFEFGTMSFTRPSLILVRNAEGHWNLERWLPPARPPAVQRAPVNGPQTRAQSTYHLQKIDFDDGRINFKLQDEKRPFAFTGVSGSVEQVSSGRWQLQLEAQPWRSGVALQSTGTVQVVGDVAGTSARLQPAQIRLHWDKVSLADLFRLITGNDSGVRGQFALDGSASVGTETSSSDVAASMWRIALQARATQIHRWDLTERDDNPRINVNVKGSWDLAAGEARAEELRVELPRSRLMGAAVLRTSGSADWQAQFQSMAVQGEDLLAWYRAFQPDVAEAVALNDLLTGSVTASGWPLRWEGGSIAGTAGSLRLPDETVARLDPFHGLVRDGKLDVEGFRVRLPVETPTQTSNEKAEKTAAKTRTSAAQENIIEAALTEDSVARQGGLRLNLHLAETAPVFRLTAALGHSLNKGWEYQGSASGLLAWNWGNSLRDVRRNGSLDLTKARLQVAGLNEPLRVEAARLEWKDGLRSAAIGKVDAFGATWSGGISESTAASGNDENSWQFQLHADHLDATELDRWIGPRSRPNWLQRLLPSLLVNTNTVGASELLRRVSAEGELTADTLTIEKIKLAKAHAKLAIHSLRLVVHDAEAQWAGGTVNGGIEAVFSPLPKYELSAEVKNVDMAQFPWPRWSERWSGIASGKIHLTTAGVGREELLKQLAGAGTVNLTKIEFRGWDVELSAESGGPSKGSSRWTSGEGDFQLSDQKVSLDGFRLEAPHQRTQLSGTISFGMDGNLTFAPRPRVVAGTHTVSQLRELRVSGQLDNPAVVVLPAEAEQVRP